jgi:hypothetical protein
MPQFSSDELTSYSPVLELYDTRHIRLSFRKYQIHIASTSKAHPKSAYELVSNCGEIKLVPRVQESSIVAGDTDWYLTD